MPSSKSSFRHVIRDRKSSPEIIIVSNETMENIGFSSGTATVAISDVPIVLNGKMLEKESEEY